MGISISRIIDPNPLPVRTTLIYVPARKSTAPLRFSLLRFITNLVRDSKLKMKFDRSRKWRARESKPSRLPAVEIGGAVETRFGRARENRRDQVGDSRYEFRGRNDSRHARSRPRQKGTEGKKGKKRKRDSGVAMKSACKVQTRRMFWETTKGNSVRLAVLVRFYCPFSLVR